MNITNADIQRYVRIALHVLAGALMAHGMTEAASWVTASTGLVLEVVTFGWSVYGMRITAKLTEMAELGENKASPVKAVVLVESAEGHALANAIPGPVLVAGTDMAKKIAA